MLAADLLGHARHRAHDAGGDALGIVMRGREHRAGDDRSGPEVARDGLGEGAADVDADAARHDDSVATDGARDASELRRLGRITNTQIAPAR